MFQKEKLLFCKKLVRRKKKSFWFKTKSFCFFKNAVKRNSKEKLYYVPPKRDEWVGFHCLFTYVTAVPTENLNIWEGRGARIYTIYYMLYPCGGQSVFTRTFDGTRVCFWICKNRGGGKQMPSCPPGSAGPDYYMHASYL